MNSFKIISGGQTGADRATLDFALKNNIECGGWCPKGRLAEDGLISKRYPLIETETDSYPDRTQKNIESSHGTLILYLFKFDNGTGLTLQLCMKLNKPCLAVKLSEPWEKEKLTTWLSNNQISILNIAGPRASHEQNLYATVVQYLEFCLF